MKIAILTSSRADYGIYSSLLQKLSADETAEYGLVVFGSHLSKAHGETVTIIEAEGQPIWGKIATDLSDDSVKGIARSMGKTISDFGDFWSTQTDLDCVVALGDRFEMFAAVAATVPFNLTVAHIHGGETSLGAIDNKFRHAITTMSDLHFAATEEYAKRIEGITGSTSGIYVTGAPSLDGLASIPLLTCEEILKKFSIDFTKPTVLFTFHPETVDPARNSLYAKTLEQTLSSLSKDYQIVITLPNADTANAVLRDKFLELSDSHEEIKAIENFGRIGYFSAITHSKFLLGNTSSGIIEAASFGKYVVNIGDRQKGRAVSLNLLQSEVETEKIFEAIRKVEQQKFAFLGSNVYVTLGQASSQIVDVLHRELKS